MKPLGVMLYIHVYFDWYVRYLLCICYYSTMYAALFDRSLHLAISPLMVYSLREMCLCVCEYMSLFTNYMSKCTPMR